MAVIYSKQEQPINQQYKTSSFSHLMKSTYTNFSSNSRHAPKKEFPLLRSLGHILEAKQLQHPRRSLGLGFDSRTSSLDDVFGCICRRRFYPSTGSRTTTTTPISVYVVVVVLVLWALAAAVAVVSPGVCCMDQNLQTWKGTLLKPLLPHLQSSQAGSCNTPNAVSPVSSK